MDLLNTLMDRTQAKACFLSIKTQITHLPEK